MTLDSYYNTFINRAEAARRKGCGFVGDKLVIAVLKEEQGSITAINVIAKLNTGKGFDDMEMATYSKAKAQAEERWLAALFFEGLSNTKYVRLKADLANQCMWGNNLYPKTVTEAYELAMRYKSSD